MTRLPSSKGSETVDYEQVMKAIGISTSGLKRRIEKAKNLARTLIESGATNRQAAEALMDNLNRMTSELDPPDLTQHRMAKRENARRSQQAVLEAKCAAYREALSRIADHPDSDSQALLVTSGSVRAIAVEALDRHKP